MLKMRMMCTEMHLSHPIPGCETSRVPAIRENSGEKRNVEGLYQENLLLHKVSYVLLCLYIIIIIMIDQSRKIILGSSFCRALIREALDAVFPQVSPFLSPVLIFSLLCIPPHPSPVCSSITVCVDADNRVEAKPIW